MKSKIVFLVCIMFFIVACEKEQIPLEKPIEAPAPSSNDEKPEEKPESTTEGQPEEKPEQQPEIQATLEKLSIAQLPHKTFYTLGEELNLNGLQLTGLYSDGKEYPVTVSPEHISGFSSEAPAEHLELTVNIEERQVSFIIQVAPVRVREGVLTEVLKGYSEITLPPNVTAIAPQVFQGNRQIAKVIMNEGLTSIGERAFFNSSIQEVIFPSTLKQLGQDILLLQPVETRRSLTYANHPLDFRKFRIRRCRRSIIAVYAPKHRSTGSDEDR